MKAEERWGGRGCSVQCSSLSLDLRAQSLGHRRPFLSTGRQPSEGSSPRQAPSLPSPLPALAPPPYLFFPWAFSSRPLKPQTRPPIYSVEKKRCLFSLEYLSTLFIHHPHLSRFFVFRACIVKQRHASRRYQKQFVDRRRRDLPTRKLELAPRSRRALSRRGLRTPYVPRYSCCRVRQTTGGNPNAIRLLRPRADLRLVGIYPTGRQRFNSAVERGSAERTFVVVMSKCLQTDAGMKSLNGIAQILLFQEILECIACRISYHHRILPLQLITPIRTLGPCS